MMRKLLLVVALVGIAAMVQAQLQEIYVTADKTEICEGDSTELFLTNKRMGDPTLKVTWSPDYNMSSTTDFAPIVKPEHTTVYTALVLDVDNNIQLTEKITISVVPRAVVIAPENSFACTNESVLLSVQQFENSSNPTWRHNGKGTFKDTDDELNKMYVPGFDEIGEVMFVITGDGIDFCGSVSDTTVITFTPATIAKITNTETYICGNSTLTLNAIAENYKSIVWQHDGRGELTGVNTLSPTYFPDANESGVINIVLKVLGEVCDKTDTLSLISLVAPAIVITPRDSFACTNESVLLSVQQFENSSNPTWKHNGKGTFEASDDELNKIYVPGLDEIGEVMFVISGDGIDYCGTLSDTVVITFSRAPTVDITNTETFICGNSTLTLNAIAENYKSIVWQHDGAGELTGVNTLNPTYSPDKNDSGTVNVMLNVIGEVCDKTDTISFEVSSIPLEFDEEIEACYGDNVILNIASLNSVSYVWSNGETGNQVIVDAKENNVFIAKVTNDFGCMSEAVIVLEVNKLPFVSLAADEGNKILTVFPEDLATYEFYDYDKNELLYSGKSNVFDYSAVSSYVKKITAIGINEFGCRSDNENTGVDDPFIVPQLIVVNAFSPNGDGINDRLLPGRKTQVFDRTSKIVYEGMDGWDGRYKGKSLPQGTYFYILFDDNKILYKGPVSILR